MLYQLSYGEFTLRYGLFREEIQDLIDNPDRRVSTHHQVDPRVIEVHLGISTVPTFHIETQEYSLVSKYYHEYYLNWLAAVDVNNQSIQPCSQELQAGLDCWRNGYLQMYLYFDNSFLRENYYRGLPTIRLTTGILWYAHRTPSTIYAMAKAIIQLCPHSPMAPLPDFQSLSPKQKEGIYHHVEEELKPGLVNHTVNRHHCTFAHKALACRATGPDLQPRRDISYEVFGEEYWVYHLPVQMLVIATVCQYQVVASHSYANFHSIDNLCQVLLDRSMERRGVSSIEPHLQKVYQDSSWEGGAPAILDQIPVDNKIEGLYNIYTNSPVATPAPSDSSLESLFGTETSDSSTGSLLDDHG
jgi:hypothetical protein